MFIQRLPVSLHAAEISKQLYPIEVQATRVDSVITWQSVEIMYWPARQQSMNSPDSPYL